MLLLLVVLLVLLLVILLLLLLLRWSWACGFLVATRALLVVGRHAIIVVPVAVASRAFRMRGGVTHRSCKSPKRKTMVLECVMRMCCAR
jgi:hypothetical protein